MSKDLMLLITNAIPESTIIESLQEALVNHKILNTKDSKQKLILYCHMLCSKDIINEMGFEALIKRTDELKQISNRLNTSDQ